MPDSRGNSKPRAALPAIFNPENLNLALGASAKTKEPNPGSTVGILTMGLHVLEDHPTGSSIVVLTLVGYLRPSSLLLTLATSYALATAIKKIGDVDIIIWWSPSD